MSSLNEKYLQEQIDWLSSNMTDLKGHVEGNSRDMDIAWLVLTGAMVFFMQAGFAMLEAGIVHPKNVTNILFKNMIDASIAAVCFWLLGYGFAFGKDVSGFIGNSNYGLRAVYNGAGDGGSDGWQSWFFQWAFNGACATIVAGSVAERAKLEAYFVYSTVVSTFIYPVVVHWVWGSGWLSAWGAFPDAQDQARPIFNHDTRSNGMIDFAGSGVVHMVGGFCGLMGAIVLGPRKGRFGPNGEVNTLFEGNTTLQSLGVFILWFGWYGFNCGSTLMISDNAANVAGKVAVTTTLSAAAGAIVATALSKIVSGVYDISMGLNGILAGLVGITASCAVVNPWMAFLIGGGAAIILVAGHYLILKLKIDDPCDACVVHGFCGLWGVLCVGIFCTDVNVQYAAYPNTNEACGSGEQFAVQVVGALCIIAWTCGTSAVLFLTITHTVGFRVSEEIEDVGLDASEHGLSNVFPKGEQNGIAHEMGSIPTAGEGAAYPAVNTEYLQAQSAYVVNNSVISM